MRKFYPEPLTPEEFSPYGDVIAFPSMRAGAVANGGTALRFDGIAKIELMAQGGRPELSYFRVEPISLPHKCYEMERHPISSQMFIPIGNQRFLIVVALGEDEPDMSTLRIFMSEPNAGVNYFPGTWHHAVIAVDVRTDFLVLGRSKIHDDEDVDFVRLKPDQLFTIHPST